MFITQTQSLIYVINYCKNMIENIIDDNEKKDTTTKPQKQLNTKILSKKINKLLGTDIDFTTLKQEEIASLYSVVTGNDFLYKLGKNRLKTKGSKILKQSSKKIVNKFIDWMESDTE